MRSELQRMRNQGMSFEDIENMLSEMKAEEAARAAQIRAQADKAKAEKEKEARVAPAREELVEAIMSYMFALGIVSREEIEEMDPNEMIEALKELEVTLDAMMKLHAMKAARRPVITRPQSASFSGDTEFNMPLLAGLTGLNPAGIIKVQPTANEDKDGDILKQFLADLEKRG